MNSNSVKLLKVFLRFLHFCFTIHCILIIFNSNIPGVMFCTKCTQAGLSKSTILLNEENQIIFSSVFALAFSLFSLSKISSNN